MRYQALTHTHTHTLTNDENEIIHCLKDTGQELEFEIIESRCSRQTRNTNLK